MCDNSFNVMKKKAVSPVKIKKLKIIKKSCISFFIADKMMAKYL